MQKKKNLFILQTDPKCIFSQPLTVSYADSEFKLDFISGGFIKQSCGLHPLLERVL